MDFNEAINKVKDMTQDWYLRMESISFLMLVHKETNQYVNIYDCQFPKGTLKIFAENMEKHPAVMGGSYGTF